MCKQYLVTELITLFPICYITLFVLVFLCCHTVKKNKTMTRLNITSSTSGIWYSPTIQPFRAFSYSGVKRIHPTYSSLKSHPGLCNNREETTSWKVYGMHLTITWPVHTTLKFCSWQQNLQLDCVWLPCLLSLRISTHFGSNVIYL